jgi:hypothetical protein
LPSSQSVAAVVKIVVLEKSTVTAVLDAASLVLTTIGGVPRGDAELFRRVGSHLVEDMTSLGFRAGVTPRPSGGEAAWTGLDRTAFDEACARLARAGYHLAPAEEAWRQFEAARAA